MSKDTNFRDDFQGDDPNISDIEPINQSSPDQDKHETESRSETSESQNSLQLVKLRKKVASQFPIDGLPMFLQELIQECADVYGTPLDFWAASIIAATGIGIGNSLKLKGKYTNNTALWWVLVGPSGTGKSEPLDFALKPLKKIDAESYERFQIERAEYENIMGLDQRERENRGIELPRRPVCSQIVLSDFTPEALAENLNNNPRGIAVHRDELMGWINDIGRYNKSGEIETMLSIWSGKSTVINRKKQEQIRIDNPCITIAGGIVIDRLDDLANDGRANNGMIPRCMFVWPENCKKPRYSKRTLLDERINEYEKYINALLTIPDGIIIKLSTEAEVLYEKFYNDMTDEANDEEIDFIREIYAKLDIIALRIALIIHGMKMNCNVTSSYKIEPETMEYAIRVTKYFRTTAIKVYSQLFKTPAEKLTKRDIILYCKTILKMTNQSEIARFIGVSPQYVSIVFSQHS